MSAPAEAEIVQGIQELGAEFRSYPVNRRGLSPVQDVRTMLALRKAFAELGPDIVLAYTIKPVIWGGLALKGRRNARFFALITGLGFAFQGQSMGRRIMTALVSRLYRAAIARSEGVIFQNPDNRDVFVDRGIVDAAKCRIVPGSGVNTERFAFAPLPSSASVFLSIGRLLGEKGFREFAQAARLVKEKYPQARFQILGGEDPSSDGISLAEIKGWEDQGLVEYLGETDDVRPYITGCHVYVLASYHEGMPRTVLEAMAVGRPIITTDAPGCRETIGFGDRRSEIGSPMSDVRCPMSGMGVGRRKSDIGEGNEEESLMRIRQGKNGFLVPVKDPNSLARAMERFIQEPELLEEMGRESRQMAEERFDVRIINQQMMEILGT
jgi:glycosyltransferase involved in cell wall biosynthesis